MPADFQAVLKVETLWAGFFDRRGVAPRPISRRLKNLAGASSWLIGYYRLPSMCSEEAFGPSASLHKMVTGVSDVPPAFDRVVCHHVVRAEAG